MIGSSNILVAGAALLAAWLGFGMAWSGHGVDILLDEGVLFSQQDSVSQPGSEEDPAPVVYLTFDDGPHPVYTPQMLDVLAAYQVKATFFAVGTMLRRWPIAAQRIVSEGHSLQLHSWGHDNLTTFSRREFITDMNRTQTELLYTAKVRATCMRPPYGAVNSRMFEWASQLGLTVELWDVSGLDWTDISSEAMASRVLRGVKAGSVVLLHDGGGSRARTVSALEMILPALIEAGYRFEMLCPPNPLPPQPPACWLSYAWPKARLCRDTSLSRSS